MMDDSAKLPSDLPFDLPFEPVHHIEIDENGPLRGETEYGGVRFRFSRNETPPPWPRLWGDPFDLTPVDEAQGLPILAEGTFRDVRDGAGGLEVFWMYMGCPVVESDPVIRERFAGFLERLAGGTATAAHLPAFFIQHYADPEVEETRRSCAGLLFEFGDEKLEAAQQSPRREQILAWAARLRGVDDRAGGKGERSSADR